MKHGYAKKLTSAGLIVLAFVIAVPGAVIAHNDSNSSPPLSWSGLSRPESVLYDYHSDVYLVSNINGSPWEKDNNGFIAKADPDAGGPVERWIAGGKGGVVLNAPKGSALTESTFWVTDIDMVRGFDRTTGAPTMSIPITGATFLNDITADAWGNLYVTDTGMNPDLTLSNTDAVYRIDRQGRVELLFTGLQPNGITIHRDKLLMVTLGGQVARYDLGDNSLSIEKTLSTPGLDGVQVLHGGKVLISANPASDVGMWQVPRHGEPMEYLDGFDFMTGAADFTIDHRRQRLVLPILFSDTLVVTPLRYK